MGGGAVQLEASSTDRLWAVGPRVEGLVDARGRIRDVPGPAWARVRLAE